MLQACRLIDSAAQGLSRVCTGGGLHVGVLEAAGVEEAVAAHHLRPGRCAQAVQPAPLHAPRRVLAPTHSWSNASQASSVSAQTTPSIVHQLQTLHACCPNPTGQRTQGCQVSPKTTQCQLHKWPAHAALKVSVVSQMRSVSAADHP
jgi:hypothetical protein